MFWLKSEPILRKIPTLTFSPPPAAGRKTRLARRQKILVDTHSQTLFIFRPLAEICEPKNFLTISSNLRLPIKLLKKFIEHGGGFWLKSEPILRKIPTLIFSPPPVGGGQE